MYGEASYDRHVYQIRDEYGVNHCVYLLDEKLSLNRVGLISENYVELLISSITEMSYRNCAEKVSETTGLSISHTGVWNVIQGLLLYQKRGIEIPESPEGLVYKNMGTMENHIWSIIARRMKHNHTSWSISGGNHLAKILAKKCSGKLYKVTEQLRIPVFEEEKLEEIKGDILQVGQIKKRIGSGYTYPVTGHLIGLDMVTRGDRRKILAMAGY